MEAGAVPERARRAGWCFRRGRPGRDRGVRRRHGPSTRFSGRGTGSPLLARGSDRRGDPVCLGQRQDDQERRQPGPEPVGRCLNVDVERLGPEIGAGRVDELRLELVDPRRQFDQLPERPIDGRDARSKGVVERHRVRRERESEVGEHEARVGHENGNLGGLVILERDVRGLPGTDRERGRHGTGLSDVRSVPGDRRRERSVRARRSGRGRARDRATPVGGREDRGREEEGDEKEGESEVRCVPDLLRRTPRPHSTSSGRSPRR